MNPRGHSSGQIPLFAAEPAPMPWKKAYMLAGRLKAGSLLGTFRQLKDAGFEGVELGAPTDNDRIGGMAARWQRGWNRTSAALRRSSPRTSNASPGCHSRAALDRHARLFLGR